MSQDPKSSTRTWATTRKLFAGIGSLMIVAGTIAMLTFEDLSKPFIVGALSIVLGIFCVGGGLFASDADLDRAADSV